MAHDIHDDGFHEIQLSGKQLVFLFMATTVVSIVIFLCGVLVGRGVQHARGTVSDVASGEAGADDSTTAAAADESAAALTADKPTAVEGLTYAGNLQSATPPPAEVRAGAADDLRQPSGPAAAEPAPPAAAAPRESPTPRQEVAAVAPPSPPSPPAQPAAAASGDGGFTVQVTALKNRSEADVIANRLQGRGYKAYVVAPTAGGQVIYKVRVGMDMQRAEAEKVMRRLQSEEKFKPWITR